MAGGAGSILPHHLPAPALELWFTLIGGLLVSLALSNTVLKRLPLTTAIFYFAAGAGLAALGMLQVDPVGNDDFLEVLTEIAVIVSLFTAGLKLRTPLTERRWVLPVRLATLSMMLTILGVALAGVYGMGLSWGAAVLLGAVLAPTDPVLASDVQVKDPDDQDKLRFGLTGEAGLNDGMAFPFVMLGLGLLGVHELGDFGWRWFAVDLVWAIVGGLGVGWGFGMLIGRLVLYLRREHRAAVGLDDFLTLGLIGLSYGVALLLHSYGFLAVFAAGLALRRIERSTAGDEPLEAVKARAQEADAENLAVGEETAPAYMAEALLGFNEQLEGMLEIAVVLIAGAMFYFADVPAAAIWFIPLLLLVIRPLSVYLGLAGASVGPVQKRYMAWFGIRGIGSVYYLAFAFTHGFEGAEARFIAGMLLSVIATSILVHGISVTPLMSLYERISRRRGSAPEGP